MQIYKTHSNLFAVIVCISSLLSGHAMAGNLPKCGGSICGALNKAKNNLGSGFGDLEKTIRTGKCGGDFCNEWERAVKPAGKAVGTAWDKSAKPVGQYIGKHPFEAAVIATAVAFGGYMLLADSPELTYSVVVETSPGVQTVIPILTVSPTAAGTTSLVAGGAGILNAAAEGNTAGQGVTPDQLEKARKFREDVQNSNNVTLAQDGEIYARYFSVTKYGRNAPTDIFALSFPLEALSRGPSSRERMATIFLGAPIHENGGDILGSGDFMNVRYDGATGGSDTARLHAAYDISAKPGTTVYAPMSGIITGIPLPYGMTSYGPSGTMLGVTITSSNGIMAQLFYVHPNPEIVEALQNGNTAALVVHAGETVIGEAQDVHSFYVEKGSTAAPQNHVHLQFVDSRGRSLDLTGARMAESPKKKSSQN